MAAPPDVRLYTQPQLDYPPLVPGLAFTSLKELKGVPRPHMKKGIILLSPLLCQGPAEPRWFYMQRMLVMAWNMPHTLLPIYLNELRVRVGKRYPGWTSVETMPNAPYVAELDQLPIADNGIYRGTLELLLRVSAAFVHVPGSKTYARAMQQPLFRDRALGVRSAEPNDVAEEVILTFVRNIDWAMAQHINALLAMPREKIADILQEQQPRIKRVVNNLRFVPGQFLEDGALNPWWTLTRDAFLQYYPGKVEIERQGGARKVLGASSDEESSSSSSAGSWSSRGSSAAQIAAADTELGTLIDDRKPAILAVFDHNIFPESAALRQGLQQWDFIFYFVSGRMASRLASNEPLTDNELRDMSDLIVVGIRYYLNWVTPRVPGTVDASPMIIDRPDIREFLRNFAATNVPDAVERLRSDSFDDFLFTRYSWDIAKDKLITVIKLVARESAEAFFNIFENRSDRGIDTISLADAISGASSTSSAQQKANFRRVERAEKRRATPALPSTERRTQVAPPAPAQPPMQQIPGQLPDAGLDNTPFPANNDREFIFDINNPDDAELINIFLRDQDWAPIPI